MSSSSGVRPLVLSAATVMAAGLAAPGGIWADTASSMTIFRASVQASTSLHVSSSALRFDTSAGSMGLEAAGSVEFVAGARTHSGGEVILTVEPLAAVECAGPNQASPAIHFEGVGAGSVRGVLQVGSPQVAGRWTGSGRRDGRLDFRVKGSAAPGPHTVPLRFVLSAP